MTPDIEAERAREEQAFERWYGMIDFPTWAEFSDVAKKAWMARAALPPTEAEIEAAKMREALEWIAWRNKARSALGVEG